MNPLKIFALLLALSMQWDKPIEIYKSGSGMVIQSSYVDPITFASHIIFAEKNDLLYMQITKSKQVTILRSIRPVNRLYTTSSARIIGNGNDLTIFASVANTTTLVSDIWYMTSKNGGKTWNEYKAIGTPYKGKYDRHLPDSAIFIKETNRTIIIYSMMNMTDPQRSHYIVMSTRAGNSSAFTNERIIIRTPNLSYDISACASYYNSLATLHVAAYYNNEAVVYYRSIDNGVTWSEARKIIQNATSIGTNQRIIARNNFVAVMYEPNYVDPVMLKVSKDSGISWENPIKATNKQGSYSYAITQKKDATVPLLLILIHEASKTINLYSIDLDTLERDMEDKPFDDNGDYTYSGVALVLGENRDKGEAVFKAFTDMADEEYRHHYSMMTQNVTKW